MTVKWTGLRTRTGAGITSGEMNSPVREGGQDEKKTGNAKAKELPELQSQRLQVRDDCDTKKETSYSTGFVKAADEESSPAAKTSKTVWQFLTGHAEDAPTIVKTPKLSKQHSPPPFEFELFRTAVGERLGRVHEFSRMQNIAKDLGIANVWLVGPSALSWTQYVHWDLQRQSGNTDVAAERFNYNWINIFRRHEPLQIVINGTSEQAQHYEERLKAEMPQVTGGNNDWQIQLLDSEHKGLPGLLESSEFLTTHRSSVARGAIELTATESQIVSDIGGANSTQVFLEDNYYRRPRFDDHDLEADRYYHPPILAALRYLVVVSRHRFEVPKESCRLIRKIFAEFNEKRDLHNLRLKEEFLSNVEALGSDSMDVAHLFKVLKHVGATGVVQKLREKEIEPIKFGPLGLGIGIPAWLLGFRKAGHGILFGGLEQYDSMTSAPDGKPNVHKSVKRAAFGEGHYVSPGNKGWTTFPNETVRKDRPDIQRDRSVPTVRYEVHPWAQTSGRRLGGDFNINTSDDYKFKNGRALRVICEKPDLEVAEYFEWLQNNPPFTAADVGIQDYVERLLQNRTQIMGDADVQRAYATVQRSLGKEEWTEREMQMANDWLTLFFPEMTTNAEMRSSAVSWLSKLLDCNHFYFTRKIVEDVLSKPRLYEVAELNPHVILWGEKIFNQCAIHEGRLEPTVAQHFLRRNLSGMTPELREQFLTWIDRIVSAGIQEPGPSSAPWPLGYVLPLFEHDFGVDNKDIEHRVLSWAKELIGVETKPTFLRQPWLHSTPATREFLCSHIEETLAKGEGPQWLISLLCDGRILNEQELATRYVSWVERMLAAQGPQGIERIFEDPRIIRFLTDSRQLHPLLLRFLERANVPRLPTNLVCYLMSHDSLTGTSESRECLVDFVLRLVSSLPKDIELRELVYFTVLCHPAIRDDHEVSAKLQSIADEFGDDQHKSLQQ
ncbi:MAG: hypothetical protein A2289_12805 [Deltaproteobacteria bacterium RIFOXYA12_FULL_58_15]|nr:MAG: hypothetical protein A2289_12805 [Deltaproteobacteria bacterium RIFOXYA12_FULL_58_15]